MATKGHKDDEDTKGKPCAKASKEEQLRRYANVFNAPPNVAFQRTTIPQSSGVAMGVAMRTPPRTNASKDTWYMNPRQPNWTPEDSGFRFSESSQSTRRKVMQVVPPNADDDRYLAAAETTRETPQYQPPPPSMVVTASPYKWAFWQ